MKISFKDQCTKEFFTKILCVVSEEKKLNLYSSFIPDKIRKITKIADCYNFSGKSGSFLSVNLPSEGDCEDCFLLIGAQHKNKKPDAINAADLGASIFGKITEYKLRKVDILISFDHDSGINEVDFMTSLCHTLLVSEFNFDEFKNSESKNHIIEEIAIVTSPANKQLLEQKLDSIIAVADGCKFAKYMSCSPPNFMTPLIFANKAKTELSKLGLKIDILEEGKLKKLGMNSMLAVASGSINEPALLVATWNGAPVKSSKYIGIVGKGVTFDSGGLSLKPARSMEEMKFDMSGAAASIGLMKSIAMSKLKLNVACVIGLVENMPSGSAYRPGDVVKAMSGKTIEVLNTDAEGRLVLADSLCYLQKNFDCECAIDIATLTGAVVVALGNVYAGLISNDDLLANKLIKAGEKSGERLCRLPLDSFYEENIKSTIADIRNTSSKMGAGTITAACFLQEFIEDGISWAHLDIAGVAYDSLVKMPKSHCKSTGFGVNLLYNFISNFE